MTFDYSIVAHLITCQVSEGQFEGNITTADGLLCMLCRSDLELISEFMMKKCYLCSFNNGGHLFAAVGGGHVITVFNVTTHQVMATFKVCACCMMHTH